MEEKILKQAKVKKTLGVIIKIFMYLVLAILITGAILLICAESGVPAAQKAMEWINAKWGVVVGAGALTAMLLLLKALTTVYNTTNNTEVKNEEMLIAIAEMKDEVVAAQAETQNAMKMVEAVIADVTSRNDAIDGYDTELKTLGDQQSVLFETMKLFVTANTNDAKIKSIFHKFEETKLFDKARSLWEESTKEEVPAEIKESAVDLIEGAKKVAEIAAPVVKETVRTIFKK